MHFSSIATWEGKCLWS